MLRFRPLLIGLLVAWCGFGLAVTLGAVSNPAAWQSGAVPGVVGTPLVSLEDPPHAAINTASSTTIVDFISTLQARAFISTSTNATTEGAS